MVDVQYYLGGERLNPDAIRKHAEDDLKKGRSVIVHAHKKGEVCNSQCDLRLNMPVQ